MRLDRFLANNSSLTRKQVKRAIAKGDVMVHGVCAVDPSIHVSQSPTIELCGEPIFERGLGYFMLNKPQGVVCSNTHRDLPTIFEFLDEDFPNLHAAGVLDAEISGLVLVTGDGDWSHRITAAKNNHLHQFAISTAEFITEKMIDKLRSGAFLEKERIRAQPAEIAVISKDEITLRTPLGRSSHVRQMLKAVNNKADRIHRIGIGSISLDTDLMEGEYRALTPSEIADV